MNGLLKKLSLLGLMLFAATTQASEKDKETKTYDYTFTWSPSNAVTGFLGGALTTLVAAGATNVGYATYLMFKQQRLIPVLPTLASAALIGAGMGTLGFIDDRINKQSPPSQAPSNIRNSRILRTLVIAAGLTPIIMSDSKSGKLMRETLKPVGEYALQAGTYALDTAALYFTTAKISSKKK